jgi:probable rRNA maturation factor
MKFKILVLPKFTKLRVKQQGQLSIKWTKVELAFENYLKQNKHFKGVKEVSLVLTLCGRTKIKTINREYRAKDKVTDVLSFGVHENLRPDLGPFVKNLPQLELGDIFICREVAKAQAVEFEITYEMEILHQLVHGFLHLLGFDHEISLKEEKLMEKEEAKLVNKIYKNLGYIK